MRSPLARWSTISPIRFGRGRRRFPRQAPAALGGRVTHDSYPDGYIRDILAGVKTIAMVGASANPAPLLCRAEIPFRTRLRDAAIIPASPARRSMACRSTRASPPRRSLLDMVDVFRRSEAAAAVVDEALAAADAAQVIWMAARRARRRGGGARRGAGREGGDEPLPEDRIRPPVGRDRLERSQLARHFGAQADGRPGLPAIDD